MVVSMVKKSPCTYILFFHKIYRALRRIYLLYEIILVVTNTTTNIEHCEYKYVYSL